MTDAVEVPPDGSVAFDALAKSLIDTAGDPDRFTFRPVVTSRPVAGADPAEISELLAELRD
ncbi:MAG: hypothetical protein GY708_28715 [Actinomycetia bacterium]|nr:hypothetical protein [Actinomycetes bacterium]MCP4958694.1 hypothetical protein [Actinomycetes bacterium]